MTLPTPPPTTPFIAPLTDPNAMDIDTTCTREEFMHWMRGKCFRCGLMVHIKKDGNHDREVCAYCKHVGHREAVCMDKFLGRSKTQKAAATGGEESTDNEGLEEASESSEKAEVVAATLSLLAQLIKQQKALTKQIAAWCEQDF